MKKTDNYSLPQWEKQDFIKMEDFNDAFGKTDAALKAHDTALAEKAAATALAAEAENRSAALALVQASGGSAPVAMVRTAEASSGHQDFSMTGSTLSVGWGKHSVSWRSTVNAPTNTMAERAGNSSGKVYFYVVLGYDDAAE